MNTLKGKTPSSVSKSKGKKNVNQKKKSSNSKLRGDLKSAPVIQSRTVRTGRPYVSSSDSSGDGRVFIRHREYVSDVFGSVDFAVQGFPINPGIPSLFPWLSTIANRYESYLFRKLRFEYETSASSMTPGSVMLAVDFDAADSAPSSKQQLMSYHNAVRSGAWEECCYRSDGPDLKKFGVQRYCRSSPPGPNLDIKTYDVGNLFLATKGESDTSVIGELYVDYDVELMTPQIAEAPGLSMEHIECSPVTIDQPLANPIYSGSSYAVVRGVSTLDFGVTSGTFLISLFETGTVFNGNNVDATVTGGATLTQIGYTGAVSPDGLHGLWEFELQCVGAPTTLAFDFVTPFCANTITSSSIRIVSY